MFWAPSLFGGGPLEFLDLHYKAHPDWDHVAKFHGDRPRELGDLVAKKIFKKTSAVKYKASRNYRSGQPNKERSKSLYAIKIFEGIISLHHLIPVKSANYAL